MSDDIQYKEYMCKKCNITMAKVPIANGTLFKSDIVILCQSCYTMLTIAKDYSNQKDSPFKTNEDFNNIFGSIFKDKK